MWRAYPAQARDKVRTGSKARLRDEFVRVCGMVLRDNLMCGRRALERFINRRSALLYFCGVGQQFRSVFRYASWEWDGQKNLLFP